MKHVMPHDLEPALAKKAAERAFDAYRQKYADYNPRLTWLSDTRAEASFSAKGVSMKGTIELLPKGISFDLEVPFLLRLFQTKAMEIMDRELRVWVDKARRGEL
jgi:putative polyhydroxyalkanoic acid system protein